VDASLLGSDTNDVAITIQFMDVPLDKVLRSMIKQVHINVVLDPKISDYVDPSDHTVHNAPLVSFRWENITIRQAIVALCKHYDLVIVKDSATGVVHIKPKN
jgi:type II secretory pathway component HofQ